jgi:hypothetical protein
MGDGGLWALTTAKCVTIEKQESLLWPAGRALQDRHVDLLSDLRNWLF